MWKLLNKSFWSGQFWPPAGESDVVLWPEGICSTSLSAVVVDRSLAGATGQHRSITGSWQERTISHDCED